MRLPASFVESAVITTGIVGLGFILTVMFISMGLWPAGVVAAGVATWLYVAWYMRQAKLARANKKAHLER